MIDEIPKVQGIVDSIGIKDLKIVRHSKDWRNILNRSFCVIDLSLVRCQGRWSMHSAISGTPVISSAGIESQRLLFPDLTVDWADAMGAISKFDMLKSGKLNRKDISIKSIDGIKKYYSKEVITSRVKSKMSELF